MCIDENDNRKIRCRMLGHEVQFGYCRQGADGVPCRKIFDCWFEIFDITQFMQQHYSAEQIKQIVAPPKPKMLTLVELIQQAQKRTQDENP